MAGRSLNKVLLIGNLTRDPELRYTANGTAVVTLGLATNREYLPSGATESVDQAEFHTVVAWTKLAELCAKLLSKGDKVFIEGRLQTRDWTDQATGKKQYKTEIVANEMILLSSRRPSDGQEMAATTNDEMTQIQEPDVVSQLPPEEEIPF